MDREEAKLNKVDIEHLKLMFKITTVEDIANDFNYQIDTIYDDFESRTCKNCKYCDSQFRYEPCPIADEMIQDIGVNFGCNEFKRKLNDNK